MSCPPADTSQESHAKQHFIIIYLFIHILFSRPLQDLTTAQNWCSCKFLIHFPIYWPTFSSSMNKIRLSIIRETNQPKTWVPLPSCPNQWWLPHPECPHRRRLSGCGLPLASGLPYGHYQRAVRTHRAGISGPSGLREWTAHGKTTQHEKLWTGAWAHSHVWPRRLLENEWIAK